MNQNAKYKIQNTKYKCKKIINYLKANTYKSCLTVLKS